MPSDFPSVLAGPSIYEFVRAHLAPGGRLDDAGRELPDEPLSGDVLRLVDPLLEQLAGRRLGRVAAHDLGRWLATTGTDRGAVKVGIAVLGATGLGPDLEVVRTLGAHDEFTLYAAVA
jgi:hypothetical protein